MSSHRVLTVPQAVAAFGERDRIDDYSVLPRTETTLFVVQKNYTVSF